VDDDTVEAPKQPDLEARLAMLGAEK